MQQFTFFVAERWVVDNIENKDIKNTNTIENSIVEYSIKFWSFYNKHILFSWMKWLNFFMFQLSPNLRISMTRFFYLRFNVTAFGVTIFFCQKDI